MTTYEIISTSISVISIVAWATTQFNTVSVIKDRLIKLEEDVELLQKQRTEDVIGFTQILGTFNVTLTELRSTLTHLNSLISEIKGDIKEIKKDNKRYGKD